VNCNPLYTPRELEHQLKDSGAEAILILENFAHTLEEVLPRTAIKTVITTQVGDLFGFPKGMITNFVVKRVKKAVKPFHLPGAIAFPQALSRGRGTKLDEPALGHEDLAFLQYTGGTTGVSKGAMLSHGNLVANLEQVGGWIGSGFSPGKEIVITALPMYHIFALTGNCLTYMKYGAHNILIPNPRDMPGFVKELAKYRFTSFTGVNTLFNGLLNTPGFAELDFSHLKVTLGGGMAVQRAVAERWKQVTKTPLVEAYGLTETSPGACINPFIEGGMEFNGTAGLPLPSTVITIRDDDGHILPIGQTGEICIAGPQVMKGYWQRPDETAKVMTPDGAFRSGDIGFMNDQGFVKIVDRKKDMILVSGFNVYPNEIEDVIAMMPGVLEVCAVAAPDEKSGEAVRVVIVKKDPALTREQVLEFCRKQMTGYKLPRIIEFWDELPKTNVGKVLRREVKNAPVRG
jgi:long-chain acyl-CoA synthetase